MCLGIIHESYIAPLIVGLILLFIGYIIAKNKSNPNGKSNKSIWIILKEYKYPIIAVLILLIVGVFFVWKFCGNGCDLASPETTKEPVKEITDEKEVQSPVVIGETKSDTKGKEEGDTTHKLPQEEVITTPNSYFIKSNENEFSKTSIITNHLSQKLNNIVDKKEQAENFVKLEIIIDTIKPDNSPRKTEIDVTITITSSEGNVKYFPLLHSLKRNYNSYDTQYKEVCEYINKQIDSIFNEQK